MRAGRDDSEAVQPALLVLNQMAGPLTCQLVEEFAATVGPVALLTGHPDTLQKTTGARIQIYPASPYSRSGLVAGTRSWIRFVWESFRWVMKWPSRIPLLVFSNPPFLPWLAYLLYRLRGQPFAIMVHDVYPDVLVQLHVLQARHPIVRMWRRLNRIAYLRANAIFTIGHRMSAAIAAQVRQCGSSPWKIEVAYPYADLRAIRPIPKLANPFALEHGQVEKLTVMYSGNMGHGHDIESVLAAAHSLQARRNLAFLFVGSGPKARLVADAAERQNNVKLLPWQPDDRLCYSLATADIAIVALEPGLGATSLPSKTFWYAAAGAAIIAICDPESELADVLRRYDCGCCVRPGRVDQLIETLVELADDPARLSGLRTRSLAAAEELGGTRARQRAPQLLRHAFGITPAIDIGRLASSHHEVEFVAKP